VRCRHRASVVAAYDLDELNGGFQEFRLDILRNRFQTPVAEAIVAGDRLDACAQSSGVVR
jgi:hypothetical protein